MSCSCEYLRFQSRPDKTSGELRANPPASACSPAGGGVACAPESTTGVFMSRLRFGIFLAPFHPAGENPTLALERDLELIEHLDRLGYDEAWIGEHHSAGSEIIASPEIFIAAAAQRTRHIRLGTGVISLAYHNPLWVTERVVLLDHLTRGRTMLGVGPGSLPTDSAMLGLSPTDTRELMDVNFDVVMRLLNGDEPISVVTPIIYPVRVRI